MSMRVTALDQAHHLLHGEEGDDAREDVQTHRHVMRVTLLPSTTAMSMAVTMSPLSLVMRVRGGGVWDEVEKGVAEKAARGKGQQDLQAGLHCLSVVQGDDVEDEEGRHRDEDGRADGMPPDVRDWKGELI